MSSSTTHAFSIFNHLPFIRKLKKREEETILNTSISIHSLPLELLFQIFSHLNSADLQTTLCVCHRWQELTLTLYSHHLKLIELVRSTRFLSGYTTDKTIKKELLLLGHYCVTFSKKNFKIKVINKLQQENFLIINPFNFKKVNYFFDKIEKTVLLAFEHLNGDQLGQLTNILKKESLYNPLDYFTHLNDKIQKCKSITVKERRDFKILKLIDTLIQKGFFIRALELIYQLENFICQTLAGVMLFEKTLAKGFIISPVLLEKMIEAANIFTGILVENISRSLRSAGLEQQADDLDLLFMRNRQ